MFKKISLLVSLSLIGLTPAFATERSEGATWTTEESIPGGKVIKQWLRAQGQNLLMATIESKSSSSMTVTQSTSTKKKKK